MDKIMNSLKNNLLSKSLRNSFRSEIFKMITPSFFVLIILPSLLSYSNSIFTIIELLGGLFFFPILMASLRCYEDGSYFLFPKIGLILRKSWKVFVVNLIVSVITALGFMCFIIPGIILWKRYIYVGVICEKELISPLESMKKVRSYQ